MTAKTIRIYLALFVLGISSWLASYYFEDKQSNEFAVVDHSPDYFSVNYYKKEMDQRGALKNELFANKMIHYSDDGTTHLESPVMTLYNSNAPPWVIKSETGILEADNDNLLLTGQVFISRDEAEDYRLFKINTSELQVRLSISFAKTSEWAELLDGSNRTEGVGFEMTFVEPIQIKFLSKVKGRYEFN